MDILIKMELNCYFKYLAIPGGVVGSHIRLVSAKDELTVVAADSPLRSLLSWCLGN